MRKKAALLGMTIPEWLPYILIGGIVLLLVSLGKTASAVVGGITDTVKGIFGTSTSGQENVNSIFKRLEGNKAVKALMTTSNAKLAENLYSAMQGMGTDEVEIFNTFKDITTPQQFAAVYFMFGMRTLTISPWYTNFTPVLLITNLFSSGTKDLIDCLKSELNKSELAKIQNQIDWLKQF